jgi:hypothetical protein
MGRSKDALFGGFSGRLGNVVGCYRYGRYYLRTLPERVNQPDTPAQLAQRMRFRLVQEYLSPFRGFLKFGFTACATGRSAYSAAMSYNLRHAIAGEYPGLAVDPQHVLLSRGTLPAAEGVALAVDNGKLKFSWTAQGDADARDNAATVALCTGLGQAVWQMGIAKRGDQSASMELPQAWKDRQVAGFICFYDNRILSHSIKPGFISNSRYAGSTATGIND